MLPSQREGLGVGPARKIAAFCLSHANLIQKYQSQKHLLGILGRETAKTPKIRVNTDKMDTIRLI